MARIEHTGAAPETTLAAPIGSGDLSFVADDLSGYPTGSVGDFYIVIDPGTSSAEKILCASRSGNNGTVASGGRGADDTVAVPHLAGAVIQHVFTASEADDANAHIEATAGVHGTSTTIVGVDDTQTLTNKTVSGASNTISNIDVSSVLFAAGWQAALTSALGTNWQAAVNAALGANWTDALDTALGTGWVDKLAAAVASGTLLTDSSTATLTNKTINGTSNTFQRIAQSSLDRYILKKNATSDGTLSAGNRATIMAGGETQLALAPTGSWSGGSFIAQWTFPVTGWYEVSCAFEFGRTNSNQNGPIEVELRSGMTSGDAASGIVATTSEEGYPAGSMGSVNTINMNILLEVTSTSSIYGLMVHNQGSHTIDRHASGTYFHVKYLGPAS